jgi:ADP-ribose pyrophosphatase YjhB (NUDIX family)
LKRTFVHNEEEKFMPIELAAIVAILQDDTVLLTKREDFEVWVLPGGQVEPGETFAETAVREAREETGLEIEITRLVGIYAMKNWMGEGHHKIVFAARPVCGIITPQPSEVLEIDYFSRDAFPEPLAWWYRQPIYDAMNGVGGSVTWKQHSPWPFEEPMSRAVLMQRYEASGLSRQEFFLRYFSSPDPMPESWQVLEF